MQTFFVLSNYFEYIATLFGAIGVWLVIKQSVWNWWVSLVSVVIYVYVFAKAQLYADAGLQIVYVALTFYGYYQWRYATAKQGLEIRKITTTQLLIYTVLITIFTIVIAQVLTLLGSSMLWLDALTAAMSLIATYMMAQKQLEHWLVWIITDLIYVYMYFAKGLHPTAILYLVFIAMAVKGYLDWKIAVVKTEYTPISK